MRRLERGHLQIIVMGATVRGAGVALDMAEMVVGEELGIRIALEAVEEALDARGEALLVVGLAHAVGAAVDERLLLDLESVESGKLDVPARCHSRAARGFAWWSGLCRGWSYVEVEVESAECVVVMPRVMLMRLVRGEWRGLASQARASSWSDQ